MGEGEREEEEEEEKKSEKKKNREKEGGELWALELPSSLARML